MLGTQTKHSRVRSLSKELVKSGCCDPCCVSEFNPHPTFLWECQEEEKEITWEVICKVQDSGKACCAWSLKSNPWLYDDSLRDRIRMGRAHGLSAPTFCHHCSSGPPKPERRRWDSHMSDCIPSFSPHSPGRVPVGIGGGARIPENWKIHPGIRRLRTRVAYSQEHPSLRCFWAPMSYQWN